MVHSESEIARVSRLSPPKPLQASAPLGETIARLKENGIGSFIMPHPLQSYATESWFRCPAGPLILGFDKPPDGVGLNRAFAFAQPVIINGQ